LDRLVFLRLASWGILASIWMTMLRSLSIKEGRLGGGNVGIAGLVVLNCYVERVMWSQ
jgi:hypothetical protein